MQNFITQAHRALLLKASLFLLVCLLAGCSMVRIGYANGDSFVYWWLNGYVDFTSEQKPWVRSHIDRLFGWHRKTQLNEYVRILSQARQRLQRPLPVTPAELHAEYAVLKKQALAVIDKAMPELVDLALSLQPEQMAHLENKLASNNEKYRKDYLQDSLEKRQERRTEQVMKHAEYWFGGFSEEQEAKIRAASEARPLNNELWLEERMRRQQELLRVLRKIQAERPSREAVTAMLKEHVAASAEYFTYAENKAYFDASRDGTAEMTAAIINLATPEQKAHAAQRMQKWIDDFQDLARK